MGTQITITTDDAGLAASLIELINGGEVPTATTPAPVAKKAAPAKKAVAKKPEPVSEPETDEEDEEPEAEEGPTLKDAVAKATGLIQGGKSGEVREVLSEFGAKKVSELKPAQIADFMEKLDDLELAG